MTQYFVIDKRGATRPPGRNMCVAFDNSTSVAVFMLGRSMSEYVIVKSDAQGDRLVPMSMTDMSEIKTSEIKTAEEQA